jgi:hypothetical protein
MHQLFTTRDTRRRLPSPCHPRDPPYNRRLRFDAEESWRESRLRSSWGASPTGRL